jgi:subtilisin-like proprotein convertase family protein
MPITLPGSATNTMGPASRYPATIHVRGEPSNGLSRVEVVLRNLRHAYPGDLDILLVSPSGAKIMLMSDAGSSFAVTNATLVFHPDSDGLAPPPENTPLQSDSTWHYSAANYGEQEVALPGGAPTGPYSTDLGDLVGANPNGIWELYIYDDKAGHSGVLVGSWGLRFFYEP